MKIPAAGPTGGHGGASDASVAVTALFPRLKPGPKRSPEKAAANQTARLHAAMIEACARKGYAATTANEVSTLAGVSKKTLYAHFGSKDACFLATYDLIVHEAVTRISAAYRAEVRGAEGGEEDRAVGLVRAFDAFVREVVERPDRSRIALVDVLAMARLAADRIDRVEATFTTMISTSLARGPDGARVPPAIIRALVGGIWFVARRRLMEEEAQSITAEGAELGEWLLAYCSPAIANLSGVRPEVRRGDGTSSVASSRSERCRMLHAAAAIVARGGCAALTAGQVVEDAGLPATGFANQFEDVADCLFAMLEWLSAGALAAALRESEGAPTWASGVCRAVQALFCRIASNPALARAAFGDPPTAVPMLAERRHAIAAGFADAFARRAPAAGRPSPVVAEAIVGGVWSIVQRQVAQGRGDRLPRSWAHAAFVAMAPIIGAEEALEAISIEEKATSR